MKRQHAVTIRSHVLGIRACAKALGCGNDFQGARHHAQAIGARVRGHQAPSYRISNQCSVVVSMTNISTCGVRDPSVVVGDRIEHGLGNFSLVFRYGAAEASNIRSIGRPS